MHSDHVSFAKGDDFEFMPAHLADQLLQRERCARRRVFLLRVMTFENLAGILELRGRSGGADNVEEQVYADGKVRSVEKSRLCRLHPLAQPWYLLVPAGGADDDVLPGTDAGFSVGNDGCGDREIDHRIEPCQQFRRKSLGIRILKLVQSSDMMTPFRCHLCHQSACFAFAEDEQVHEKRLIEETWSSAEKSDGSGQGWSGTVRLEQLTQRFPDRLGQRTPYANGAQPPRRRLLRSRRSN